MITKSKEEVNRMQTEALKSKMMLHHAQRSFYGVLAQAKVAVVVQAVKFSSNLKPNRAINADPKKRRGLAVGLSSVSLFASGYAGH